VGDTIADGDDNRQVSRRRVFGQATADSIRQRFVAEAAI
jgi:hypothetical protein